MKKMILNPVFIIGLLIRLCLIFLVAPLAVTNLYAPFLDFSTDVLSLDPWYNWIQNKGDDSAFPYGIVMWGIFLPFIFFAKAIGAPLLYAYSLTLLIADFSLLLILNKLIPNRQNLLLFTYWFSPIIILASYILGLNDVIPALLIILAILFLKQNNFKLAGVFLAAAVSAKLSMIITLPFFIIYLFNNRTLRNFFSIFLISFSLSLFVFEAPYLLSGAGIQMILNNPEMGKVYQLSINLTQSISVYLVPFVYLIMLYFAWRIKRLNFDLFQAITGMAFLLIVLLTPASPGWFVWCLPFLILYEAMSGRIAIILVSIFSATYFLSTLLATPIQLATGQELFINDYLSFPYHSGNHLASLLHTGMVAIGLILAIRIWREAVKKNDFFRLSRKPFIIGIAGDSGAGKDTFSDAISALFGENSVTKISGDDYHLWDRQKPMWQVMTHLNPMANDLEGFSNDLVLLNDGKSILSRHYNHTTGKMSKPHKVKSNDFIIASGLHALYLPVLRECCNLKIYLNIDEELRRYFKLQRDVHQRGHTVERVLNSFEKREPDSERFIRPQAKYADLIISLQPIHPQMLKNADDKSPIRLKLSITTKNGFNKLALHRVLVGVCGLHVDIIVSENGAEIQLTIEGETTSSDIEMAAQILCPRVLAFLDIEPKWQDGLLGLMQLITLTHINQALTKRFIE
ncbi:nucleoside/nucleotide kinase family protein [Acinetobacter faecalis]|uniref:hypothetical protein n=1 Tax=Acinetobacter faecalis TaxID=2665161 RepID=UPI002A91A221|nr:hypothetical protein [Acinetobacter faecalis]MDY6484287.1 hypothetical protein [Acinetobacter faecalis]